jgi:hypothetical protein
MLHSTYANYSTPTQCAATVFAGKKSFQALKGAYERAFTTWRALHHFEVATARHRPPVPPTTPNARQTGSAGSRWPEHPISTYRRSAHGRWRAGTRPDGTTSFMDGGTTIRRSLRSGVEQPCRSRSLIHMHMSTSRTS